MKHLSAAGLFFVAACTHVDTGEIDYRRADSQVKDIGVAVKDTREECTSHLPPPTRIPYCEPMLTTRLIHKNVSVEAPIKKGDFYSIRLEQAVINHMPEEKFSVGRMMLGKNPGVKVGEVAVLVNAFEVAPADASDAAVQEARFMFVPDPKRLKLVYYSEDVEDRQALNFSNIPLKVEAEYGGRPIGIQIVVLELDQMGPQLQGLLKTLADLGKEVNAIPGGAAGTMLAELGMSLLSGSHDDTMFDYIFMLDPSEAIAGVKHAAFEEGRYVLRRLDKRGVEPNWRNLRLDLNTGKLWQAAGDDDSSFSKPFVDETYFTINIIKHPKEGVRSRYALQTMEQLTTELEQQTTNLDRAASELKDDIDAKTQKLRAAKWDSELSNAWSGARTRYLEYAQTLEPMDIATAGCTIPAKALHRRAEAGMAAKSAAMDFIQLFHKSLSDKIGDKLVLANGEQRKVLALLASYFLPGENGSTVLAEDLVAPSAFANKFKADTADFYQAMDQAAMAHWRPKTCVEAIGLGNASAAAPAPTVAQQ